MNKFLARKIHWALGTAVALIGVAAVRLLAPELNGTMHKTVMVAGYVLSLSGILIIARSGGGAKVDQSGAVQGKAE